MNCAGLSVIAARSFNRKVHLLSWLKFLQQLNQYLVRHFNSNEIGAERTKLVREGTPVRVQVHRVHRVEELSIGVGAAQGLWLAMFVLTFKFWHT